MAVNMAYVPKPESGTKVLKMTPPWNGSADIALSEKQKQQPFWCAYSVCFYGWLLEGKLCLAIIFSKKMTMQNARSAANYAWNH